MERWRSTVDPVPAKNPCVEPPASKMDLNPSGDFFDEKYMEVVEDQATIENLRQIVTNIEQALKAVSDNLMEVYRAANKLAVPTASMETEDLSESFR